MLEVEVEVKVMGSVIIVDGWVILRGTVRFRGLWGTLGKDKRVWVHKEEINNHIEVMVGMGVMEVMVHRWVWKRMQVLLGGMVFAEFVRKKECQSRERGICFMSV